MHLQNSNRKSSLSRRPIIHLTAGLLLTMSTWAAAQQHPHAHGRLSLDVVVDEKVITMRMEAPLDNFLGFERAPRNDAERTKVNDMVKRLYEAGELFIVDPKAGCRLGNVHLQSAVLGLGEGANPTPVNKTGRERASDEHADIDVEITFACRRPEDASHIEVRLFDVFKAIRRVDVQVASGQGQFKRALTKTTSTLRWGK